MIELRDKYPLQEDGQYPFYAIVPKGFRENLAFRERCLRLGEESKQYREQFWEMCRRDVLFFLNVFCWIEEPREPRSEYRRLPFITRGMQDAAIDQLLRSIPYKDICIYKSRATGASWIMMALATHQFLFDASSNVGVVSAKKELVDHRDNSCLFDKIDFLLSEKWMPWWLLPRERCAGGLRYVRNDMVFYNPENDSSINGYACTDDVGRGGRKLFFIGDELAFWPRNSQAESLSSMRGNTNCRVMLSTSNGPGDAYHNWVENATARGIELIDLYWQDDPEKRAGLYTSEGGQVKVLDREFWAGVLECPEANVENVIRRGESNYQFVCDGTVRSPYKDWEIGRADNELEIERELERVFTGKGGTFFTIPVFEQKARQWGCGPIRRGHFLFDVDNGAVNKWVDDETSGVLLWLEFIANLANPHLGVMVPNEKRYVVASDVAAGTGGSHSSNSVAVIADLDLGEQVGEFAVGNMPPHRFARWCAGVAKFFNNALLIWDANGPTGAQFTRAIGETNYGNLYRQTVKETITEKETEKLGFRTGNDDQKTALLNGLQQFVEEGHYMIRSPAAYAEVPQYIWKDGKVVHSTSVMTDDPSAQKKAHGDRVIAHALAVEAIKYFNGGGPPRSDNPENPVAPPYGTFAWRMREVERRERPPEGLMDGEEEWEW